MKFEHLLDNVKGGGPVRLMALKVCKNFERNWPVVGANNIFHVVIYIST